MKYSGFNDFRLEKKWSQASDIFCRQESGMFGTSSVALFPYFVMQIVYLFSMNRRSFIHQTVLLRK